MLVAADLRIGASQRREKVGIVLAAGYPWFEKGDDLRVLVLILSIASCSLPRGAMSTAAPTTIPIASIMKRAGAVILIPAGGEARLRFRCQMFGQGGP